MTTKAHPQIVCWQVSFKGQDDDLEMYYAAETAGKAKCMSFIQACEADMGIPFTDFRARRAPQYDQYADKPGSLGWRDKSFAYGLFLEHDHERIPF